MEFNINRNFFVRNRNAIDYLWRKNFNFFPFFIKFYLKIFVIIIKITIIETLIKIKIS